MNINIEEIVKEEYELIGKGYVFGTYPTIADAVKGMQTYRPDYVRCQDMKIRHKLTAYIDKTVDCSELLKKKIDTAFHK